MQLRRRHFGDDDDEMGVKYLCAKLEVSTAVKIQFEFFCVMTPCSVVVG
jgi:hypothetical protein